MKSLSIVKQDKTHGVHVRSVDIWQGLGYAEHRMLKVIIQRHSDVLGKVAYEEYKPEKGGKGGRPEKTYLLTERQFLIVALMVVKHGAKLKGIIVDGLIGKSVKEVINIISSMDIEDIPPDRYVYVAQESESGRYKIGISKDPERRIKELNIGNPEQLKLIHYFKSNGNKYESETLTHKMYEAHKLRSEWFDTAIDLNLLEGYSK